MRYLKRPYDYEFFLTLHSLTAEDRLQVRSLLAYCRSNTLLFLSLSV
jgi:hypothetical protein